MNDYIDRVRKVAGHINCVFSSEEDSIWEILENAQPVIFDGHFEFYGYHSDAFFDFRAISRYPFFMSKIASVMFNWIEEREHLKPSCILGSTGQGMYLAFDVASKLCAKKRKVRSAYVATEECGRSKSKIIEGFQIASGDNVVILADMCISGAGIENMIRLVEKAGAEVAGICVFATRGNQRYINGINYIEKRYNFHSIIDFDLPFWSKKDCSMKCDKSKKVVSIKDMIHLPIYEGSEAYPKLLEKMK